MDKRLKISALVISGILLLLAAGGVAAAIAFALFFGGPKHPAKAERELAKQFDQNAEVFERLASIAREDRKHIEDSITIKRRGSLASSLSSGRVAEYRSLLSSLGAERIALSSSSGNLAIKIDFHSWGYADTYQVVGWYFLDPYDKDRLYPEAHRVDSIANPYRHPEGHDTTSLESAKRGWWYFLERGG
ncbi:MAG: hypothetical protein QE273_17620 [Verrucomicrobiales bacterium]|nr:hypothetical protein [Verrucomicrobiales bacterium]